MPRPNILGGKRLVLLNQILADFYRIRRTFLKSKQVSGEIFASYGGITLDDWNWILDNINGYERVDDIFIIKKGLTIKLTFGGV